MLESRKKIMAMKEELDFLRLAKKKETDLYAKRNEIEIQMTILLEEIERLHKTLHSQEQSEFNFTFEIENQIKERELLLKNTKWNLREIDHILDQIDEETESTIKTKEEELIRFILEKFPEEKADYSELKTDQEHLLIVQEDLRSTVTLSQHLLELIQNVLFIRSKVRSIWILSYILGPNPNIQISKHFEAIKKLIRTEFDSLKQRNSFLNQNEQSLDLLYKKTTVLLEQLEILCSTRWSFKKIDQSLAPYYGALKNLIEQMEEEEIQIKNKEIDCQQKLGQFMEKYSDKKNPT